MPSSKIKILHLIKSLGRGGAETLLSETLGFHDQELFEFHYGYFLPWKDQMVDSIIAGGGKVICFRANNNLALMMKATTVVDYVEKNGIQLIHAHLPWAGIVARLVAKMTGVVAIYTEHNKQERYHIGTRIVNLFTMNWLTRVIAVSADVEESIRQHKRGLSVRVQTILNGVNTERFKRNSFDGQIIRSKLNIPNDAFVIGTIAVFRSQKRLDRWIELAAKINAKFNNVHFIIVGDGPLKRELLNKTVDLGVAEKIHMPGLETEVRPYLAAFDLYMMTSVFEGLPLALLEAMSMECPVMSTDAGGIKEVIRHEEDGLLCSVEESIRLVDYALLLLGDKALRLKLGRAARARVLNDFNMQNMVRQLESIYREVVMG